MATIAWGQRMSIINNGNKLMRFMNYEPHEFILNYSKADEQRFENFVHRTFNNGDCVFFLRSLKNIYTKHGGLEKAFSNGFSKNEENVLQAIVNFRTLFLQPKHLSRVEKHLSNPAAKSSAKRLCMYLRWLVEKIN